VASTGPSGPAIIIDRDYTFRAAAYSAARRARPAHTCSPPVEWYSLATMHTYDSVSCFPRSVNRLVRQLSNCIRRNISKMGFILSYPPSRYLKGGLSAWHLGSRWQILWPFVCADGILRCDRVYCEPDERRVWGRIHAGRICQFLYTIESMMPTREMSVFREQCRDTPFVYENGNHIHHHVGPWTAAMLRLETASQASISTALPSLYCYTFKQTVSTSRLLT